MMTGERFPASTSARSLLASQRHGVGPHHQCVERIQFASHFELVLRPLPLPQQRQQLEHEDPALGIRRVGTYLCSKGLQRLVQPAFLEQIFGNVIHA